MFAILIPCYNEEKTIGKVIDDFSFHLPSIPIYVYDNASTDNTATIAQEHGAIVRYEGRKGKGNVIRRMFSDIDAEYYILVDGDATYDAKSAKSMIDKAVNERIDMITGVRKHTNSDAYRFGHVLGNRFLTGIVSLLFQNNMSDMLSGYRVFSKRFVKSFPIMSSGFEIETEFTIHALELSMPTSEIETPYYERPEGSFSKLSTYKDGFKILFTILKILKIEKPLLLFGIIGVIIAMITFIIDVPVFLTYFKIHLVPRIPTIILSSCFYGIAMLFVVCGLIMDNISILRREQKTLVYLNT